MTSISDQLESLLHKEAFFLGARAYGYLATHAR
jgi:hypothetical protein